MYFERPCGNFKVSECCSKKLLPYSLSEKYTYILALEMASPGNQHRASCIGTLSFPMIIGSGLVMTTARRACCLCFS